MRCRRLPQRYSLTATAPPGLACSSGVSVRSKRVSILNILVGTATGFPPLHLARFIHEGAQGGLWGDEITPNMMASGRFWLYDGVGELVGV